MAFQDASEFLNQIIAFVSTGTRTFQTVEQETLKFEGLEIDDTKRLVKKNNQEVELTYTEFEILYLLASSPGRVFSKEQIYNLVWEESYSGDYDIVMSHIHNIREKIEDTSNKPVYIQTVWGVGYKFNEKLKEADITSHYGHITEVLVISKIESCKIPR